jgi:aminomuconate-semialdehyde/2-hydroxymuconate-6-semialdehyde dehydrogenase
MVQVPKISNFIHGEFAAPVNGLYLDNINPATGQVIGLVPDSDGRDADAAVQSARQAFSGWSRTTRRWRADMLLRIAALIEARAEAFAFAESRDQGKPVSLARSMDIPRAIENFRYFAGAILHDVDAVFQGEAGASKRFCSVASREPVGVCALITPWNLPLYLLTWKLAPALAMGNTVVCKPSELTSTTAAMLADVLNEAGLPPGVCNIVYGRGAQIGNALVAHEHVALVSFTGGTETGKSIAAAAASTFKKVSLELGGKNPSVVFADADLERAVATCTRAAFLNQGEICLAGSRIYVERSIYPEFLARMHQAVEDIVVGDPEDARTTMGPVVSASHRERIAGFVEAALASGARIMGESSDSARSIFPKLAAPFAQGCFVSPTVLVDVARGSAIQRQEVFGPVVTVTPFDSESEAVALANDVDYGLSAVVFTQNIDRAQRVSRALHAGTVWINTWLARDLRVPFGGVKASGVGREGGRWSLDFYSEYKTIVTATVTAEALGEL